MGEITRPCVLPVPEGSHFSVQNLPFGTFRRRSSNTASRTGVRIGDNVLDMACLADAGCFQGRQVDGACFHQVTSCSAPAGAGFAQAPWHLHMAASACRSKATQADTRCAQENINGFLVQGRPAWRQVCGKLPCQNGVIIRNYSKDQQRVMHAV